MKENALHVHTWGQTMASLFFAIMASEPRLAAFEYE